MGTLRIFLFGGRLEGAEFHFRKVVDLEPGESRRKQVALEAVQ
jgi:hypothetical protein